MYVYRICLVPDLFLSLIPVTISLISPSYVVAGERVTLTCSITLPAQVTGTPVFHWQGPLTSEYASSESGDLVFDEIATSQAGLYICKASHRLGYAK